MGFLEMALCDHPEHELKRWRDPQRRCLILQVGQNREARYQLSDYDLQRMMFEDDIRLNVLLWIADVCAYDKGEDRPARAEAVKDEWRKMREREARRVEFDRKALRFA